MTDGACLQVRAMDPRSNPRDSVTYADASEPAAWRARSETADSARRRIIRARARPTVGQVCSAGRSAGNARAGTTLTRLLRVRVPRSWIGWTRRLRRSSTTASRRSTSASYGSWSARSAPARAHRTRSGGADVACLTAGLLQVGSSADRGVPAADSGRAPVPPRPNPFTANAAAAAELPQALPARQREAGPAPTAVFGSLWRR